MAEDNRRNNDMLIGQLIAESEAGKKQRELLFEHTSDIKAMIGDLTVVVQTGITAGESKLEEAETKIAGHSASIGKLKKFNNRALLGMASIGGATGITGYVTGIGDAIMTKIGVK